MRPAAVRSARWPPACLAVRWGSISRALSVYYVKGTMPWPWNVSDERILFQPFAAAYARHLARMYVFFMRMAILSRSAPGAFCRGFRGIQSRKSQRSAPRGKKVAIIGSGPAGMSAAYYLTKFNLSVTIFEAAHEPGGLLRYAIPEFRLPQKVLDEQFSQLKLLGVEIQTDVVFGRTMMIDELLMRGFSAVLLATGASLPRFNDLPGNSLAGVYYDTEFLSRLQTTNKEDAAAQARQQMIISAQNSDHRPGTCGF